MNKDHRDYNTLYALESLNRELMDVIGSKEYTKGKKIVRWKEIIKKHEVISSLPNFFKHRKVKEVYLEGAEENFPYPIWKYNLHYGNADKKIVIFTCITGNYDKPKEPLMKLKNVDYILFTDLEIENHKIINGWVCRSIPSRLLKMTNIEINRYIKMHPFEFFKEQYDFSIYIDGNVQIVSDVSTFTEMVDANLGIAAHTHRFRNCIYSEGKICELKGKGNIERMRKQLESYKTNLFPKHYGLIECTVMVTQLNNDVAKSIYKQWWYEFNKYKSMRDQLSLPYVLWKNGIQVSAVGKLGKNLYRNTKIRVYDH